MHTAVAELPLVERIGALRLLARLLSAPPGESDLRALAVLAPGSNRPLDASLRHLASAARSTTPEQAGAQFQRLFIGLGGGELVPFASHYLSGSLHDKPLIELRQDMRRIGLAQSAGVAEPEDHAATVLEMAAGLVDGSIATDRETAAHLLRKHVVSWLPRFFDHLSRAQAAPFYAAVGSFGAAVMAEEHREQGGTP